MQQSGLGGGGRRWGIGSYNTRTDGALRIGITGGLCSGKSQALKWLERDGVSVLDSSALALSLLERELKLVSVYDDFLRSALQLDPKNLSRHAKQRFLAVAQRQEGFPPELQAFIAETLRKEIKHFLYSPIGSNLRAVEDSMIVEQKTDHLYNEIWTLNHNPGLQKERLIYMEKLSAADAERLIANEIKGVALQVEMSHRLIDNEGTITELEISLKKALYDARQKRLAATRFA